MTIKYLVILLLVITALLIMIVHRVERVNNWIARKPLKEHKTSFIVFSLLFVAGAIAVSKCIGDSLAFLNFQEHYSTGVWAAIYCAFLYLFFFHDFELNGWVKSKEKEWKEIRDIDLFHMLYNASKYIIKNDLSEGGSVEVFIELLIVQVNLIKPGSAIIKTDATYCKRYKDFLEFKYKNEIYFVEDERIVNYLSYIVNLVALKND